MQVIKGKCTGCEREAALFYKTNLCIVCTRLDANEKIIQKMMETLKDISESIAAFESFFKRR